jgi:predicted RNA-binding Zn-ribbon protein involved in translation (DUF1610 family)
MRIKESKYLSSLANEVNMTEKQLSETLVNELVNRELVSDDVANYGNLLLECFEPDIQVSDVVGLLNSIGIKDVKSKHITWLVFMKIIGDGECPECGGEMETIDADYRRTGGDGYLTPLEYEPLWEEKVCRNCGNKIIVER